MNKKLLSFISIALVTTFILAIVGPFPWQLNPRQSQGLGLSVHAQESSAPAIYQDPQGQFQVGILPGYTLSTVAGTPLFESPDKNIAYTVATRFWATDTLSSSAQLIQVAVEAFVDGEGFVPGTFEDFGEDAKIPWTGQVTVGRKATPLQGLILARKVPGNVLALLIAAVDSEAGQLDSLLNDLTDTLQAVQQ